MKLRNILFIILFINATFLFSEESSLSSHYFYNRCQLKEEKIIGYGTLEEQSISESNYYPCWIFSIEKINEIDSFLYYVPRKISPFFEYKIEINNQQFCFKDISLFIPSLKLYSFCYAKKLYLILLSEIGKYGDKICLIFDITNPDNITFYPPEERFIEAEMLEKFIGVCQNKLCFFFSTKRYEWNGQYKLAPYYIEGDSLKQLCDKNGKPYFVDYSYKTKYEQEYVIDDKYIPPKETDKVQ